MWIALDPQLTEATGQRIDQQQSTNQRLAETNQQLERFQRLQAANHAHQRPHYTGFAAGQLGFATVP